MSAGAVNESAQLTLARPTGATAGDVLIAVVANQGGSAKNVLPPSGWTAIPSTNYYQGTNARISAWMHVDGGVEPASYTFQLSGGDDMSGGILAVAGANTLAPINASLGRVNASSATSVTAPSVTTTVANALLVFAGACSKAVTFTPPPGMAEHWDVASGGLYRVATEAASQTVAAAGATGTRAARASSSCKSVAISIAVTPAS